MVSVSNFKLCRCVDFSWFRTKIQDRSKLLWKHHTIKWTIPTTFSDFNQCEILYGALKLKLQIIPKNPTIFFIICWLAGINIFFLYAHKISPLTHWIPTCSPLLLPTTNSYEFIKIFLFFQKKILFLFSLIKNNDDVSDSLTEIANIRDLSDLHINHEWYQSKFTYTRSPLFHER